MNIRKFTILVLLLLQSTTTYAQVPNLSLLESLSGGLPNGAQDSDINADEINNNDDNKNKSANPLEFEDLSYGYTGGRDFINPPQEKYSKESLKYFGYDFFSETPSSPESINNIPISPDYLIGPNDNIKVILFGNVNAKYDLKVTRDGEIFFPAIGPISVAGLTFKDLNELIQRTIENQYIGTQVTLTFGSLRSIDIFVLGEALKPGLYSTSALSTLTNAVIKSGGINKTGSLRNIQLKRQGKIISKFDFYDLLLKGDTSKDLRLMQGDVVFIPPVKKTVGISGEVSRPGIYELKDNETLEDLINFAGNLKPKADLVSADLLRVDQSNNSFQLLSVELRDNKQQEFKLNNGDVLAIHAVVDNLTNAILLSGHAQQPGFYPWSEGMRIKDLIKSPDSLLSMTDMQYVLIKRVNKMNQKYEFIQLSMDEVFNSGSEEHNISLSEKDEIVFFPTMLSPEQITTSLIQDKYILDKEMKQMVLEENQWTSMTYLRKSLLDEQLEIRERNAILPAQGSEISVSENQDIRRYYEYSINDYCTIPQDLIISILDSTGYRVEKSIPLNELDKISSPEDLIELQRSIEDDRISASTNSKKDFSSILTMECRNNLLQQTLNIIDRQTAPSELKKIITVFGNVHFPGTYPLTNDMTLRQAIKAAGGFKQSTYDAEIELSRSNNSGKKYTNSNFLASLESNDMDTKLEGMDIINIKEISSQIKTVEIKGEVYFAGTYPISVNETLSEIIKRAGGITDYADLKATVFHRKSLRESEIKRLKTAQDELKRKIVLSSQAGGLGQNSLDSSAIGQLTELIVGDSNQQEALGRLVVDVEAMLEGSVKDLYLQDEDTIFIPKTQQSITVMGEVYVANTHLYRKNLSIEDYIKLSGGATDYADRENAYLVKSNGSIISPSQLSSDGFFRSGSSNNIEPGDTIIVPLQVQPFSSIRATTEITQIIYQMALAAAAVNSF